MNKKDWNNLIIQRGIVMKKLILLCVVLFLQPVNADNLSSDLDSLGTSPSLYKKAKKLSRSSKYRIVQKRTVDRNLRFEFGLTGATVFGGDSYYSTNMQGLNVNFHFTPNWSVGLSHYGFANSLTNEGKRVFDVSENRSIDGVTKDPVPDLDFPIEAQYLTLNWYPIYGKLNLFNNSVSHFDMYTILGIGNMKLNSGAVSATTVGVGTGFWWTKHLSSRIEARYNAYQDKLLSGSRNIDTMVLSISLGVLL